MTNRTNIFIVLDESGSMGWTKAETLDGLNMYISQQKERPNTFLSIIKFQSIIPAPLFESCPIDHVPKISDSMYMPGGGTALNDALGRVLSTHLENDSQTDTNVIVIITDGEENASKNYNSSQVNDLLGEAKAKNWEVIFMGANMTKQAVTSTYANIWADNVNIYSQNAVGTASVFSAASTSTSVYSELKSRGLRSARVNVGDVYATSMSKGGTLESTDVADILAKAMAVDKDKI